tara:strand:- start:1244 stop:1741 length:498 start_codon:yes stop_codon:yes gene_type:complete
MGSDVFVNGPWLCIGEPDYEAPKRAFEKMMQRYFPEYEFGHMDDIAKDFQYLTDHETPELFDDLGFGWTREFHDFRLPDGSGYDVEEAAGQMESIIDSFPETMTEWRATSKHRFANGAVMFLAAGEDYGSYGNAVADDMSNCENRWFPMTGWKPASAFNLTPKEE